MRIFLNACISAAQMENSWLINEASFLQASNLNIKAKLTDFNQVPYALKSLQLYINSPSKHLFKAKLETNLDGLINIDFKVPDKT